MRLTNCQYHHYAYCCYYHVSSLFLAVLFPVCCLSINQSINQSAVARGSLLLPFFVPPNLPPFPIAPVRVWLLLLNSPPAPGIPPDETGAQRGRPLSLSLRALFISPTSMARLAPWGWVPWWWWCEWCSVDCCIALNSHVPTL